MYLNTAISTEQNLLKLLNSKATRLIVPNDFELGIPTAITPSLQNNNKNTQLALWYKGAVPLSNLRTTVRYDRLTMLGDAPANDMRVNIHDGATAQSIHNQVMARWKLLPEEIVVPTNPIIPRGQRTSIFNYAAKANSPIYVPNSALDVEVFNVDPFVGFEDGVKFFYGASKYPVGSNTITNEVSETTYSGVMTNSAVVAVPGPHSDRSLNFAATRNYVRIPYADLNNVFEGNFTVECWIKRNGLTGIQVIVSQWREGSTRSLLWGFSGNNLVVSWGTSSSIIANAATSTDWMHVAMSRQGNVFRQFINGVMTGNVTNNNVPVANMEIDYLIGTCFTGGYTAPSTNASSLVANISHLAIHDYAKYTANFTPGSMDYEG